MFMIEGHDIMLVVTVRGPLPWSKPGGDLVKALLVEHGNHIQKDLASLSDTDKPADWQKVEIDYRVFEERYARPRARRRV